jgi:hypothetical protein
MRSLYTAAVFWAALCSSAAVRNESELSEALARISSSTGGGGDIIEFQDNIFLTETVRTVLPYALTLLNLLNAQIHVSLVLYTG